MTAFVYKTPRVYDSVKIHTQETIVVYRTINDMIENYMSSICYGKMNSIVPHNHMVVYYMNEDNIEFGHLEGDIVVDTKTAKFYANNVRHRLYMISLSNNESDKSVLKVIQDAY